MPHIATKTTYLQMLVAPNQPMTPPARNLHIERMTHPDCQEYRELYRSVGEKWNWVDRLLMENTALQAILLDPQVFIYVLHIAGKQAGYVELDARDSQNIELVYFGLFPQFIGKGLGKYFLNWVVQQAWTFNPQRLWVHTCDLDHPAALPNYLKAGFEIYDEKVISQFVPEASP
jgi:GNAT superfamily N-acetyltransferase